MSEPVVVSSRVRLARNYEDFPFDVAEKPEMAAACIARTRNALALSGADRDFTCVLLRETSERQRKSLEESHLISSDLLKNPETAAVLLNEEDAVSVMINEEDHLRIQAIDSGLELTDAAEKCFRVDDALSRNAVFAFDKQLGYLTSCPTNTGTGMRASLVLHLPMVTRFKQMGNVGQIVAKVGLTIRGVYGEGSDALGNLYQVSNQVTLGRTEQELISTVSTVGTQLTDMEQTLRHKAFSDDRLLLEDTVYRAWAVLRNARLLGPTEFFKLWSDARLGAAMGLVPFQLAVLDGMLEQAQDAHLCAWMEKDLDERQLQEARATRVREIIRDGMKQ